MSRFEDLPKELLEEIFNNFNVETLLSQCSINKKIARLCQDERFWGKYVNTRYYVENKPDDISWKDFAILLDQILFNLGVNYGITISTDLFRYLVENHNNIQDLESLTNRDDFSSPGIEDFGYDNINTLPSVFTNTINNYNKMKYPNLSKYIKKPNGIDIPDYPLILQLHGNDYEYIKSIIEMIKKPK
jgi:hypothetical protein